MESRELSITASLLWQCSHYFLHVQIPSLLYIQTESKLKSIKLKAKLCWLSRLKGGGSMKRKKAIVIVELVDEANEEKEDVVKRQIIEWFQEDAVTMPWVRELKSITIKQNK